MHDLTRVLAEYPQLGRLLTHPPPERHSGFSGAAVWKAATEAGVVAVRKWPAGWNATRLVGLHRLLEFLSRDGMEIVAVPFRSRAGHTLLVNAREFFQAEPWLPGSGDYRARPSPIRLKSAMTALARWHLHAARFQPDPAHREWFASELAKPSPAVQERRARVNSLSAATVRQWGQIAAAAANEELRNIAQQLTHSIIRNAASVSAMLAVAASVAVPLQPVLRDVWHDHILFTGDEVTGIIDPSACRTESVTADLARLLGSLCGNDVAAWDLALTAYQARRPLSPAELGLVPVLDRSGVLLAGITWLEWLGPQQRFSWNDPHVLPRVHEITERLQHP